MSEFTQGLMVSLWGLASTFIAIGLLVVVIILIDKAFPEKAEEEKEEVPELSTSILCETEPPVSEAEIAAVIAAAIYALRETEPVSADLGRALEAGHGPWWAMHQTSNATHQLRRSEK
ncbi:MAG: OadG family protein [Chloroflexi bacterium]|nr:OadG family protein [Chloroflexota bacterium]